MLSLFGSLIDLLRLVFSYLNRRLFRDHVVSEAKYRRKAEDYDSLARALRVRRAARDAVQSGELSNDKYERKHQE